MATSYVERLQKIRLTHPRAYERWSEEVLLFLRRSFDAGESIETLAEALQRQPGAISSRLRKLGLFPAGRLDMTRPTLSLGLGPMDTASDPIIAGSISLRFEWRPVLANEETPYMFPGPVTAFMRKRYGEPVIYRWTARADSSTKPDWLYVGSTKCLCPERLNGYLSPERSKTNSRINLRLHQALKDGLQVSLEILSEGCLTIGSETLTSTDLQADPFRLAIERLLIACYRWQGGQLLNV